MSEFEYRISGHDFVRAMQLAGYRFVCTTPEHAVLKNDRTQLLVPKRDHLEEPVVLALLETAGMLPLQLVSLLNRLGSRDTVPEQSELQATKSSHRK
jgi:hypothetical protein